MTTHNRTVEAAAPAATVVDREAAEALPALPLEGFEGVTYKLLWRSGKSVAGIMHVPPGREVGAHVHQRSHHHIWVQEGSAEMVGGRRVGPGSYVHVPAGVEHGITGVEGPEGLTIYYLYLREPDGARGAASQPG
ncbi:MAG TPA: cupin domain-containing protein [Acidimicrobiales bacterium]